MVPANQAGEPTGSAIAAGLPPPGVGGFLLQAGVLVMAAGLAMSLALMHAGLAMAVVGLLMTRTSIHRLPGFWWAVAYAGWQLVSMVTSSMDGGEPLLIRGYGSAYTWLAMYAAIEGFRVAKVRMWGVLLASACATVSLLLASVQFWIGFGGQPPLRIFPRPDGINRFTSAGFFPLHLTQGFMMTQIVLMAWTQPIIAGRWKPVQWAGRLAPLGCILLTGGRTGLVALIAGVTVWFGSAGRRSLMIAGGMGVIGVLLAGAWLTWMRPQAVKDVLSLHDGRIIHWQVAGVLISEHPLLGVGGAHDFKRENNGVIARLYPDGSQNTWLDAPDAHNSFLGIASEYGVPALVLYLGFISAVLLHLWRARQTHPWAWRLGCGLVASAVCAGQFEHLAGHSTTCYGLFVPLGFAVALTFPERLAIPPVDDQRTG